MLQLLPSISLMITLHEHGSCCSIELSRGQYHVMSDARAALKQMLNLSVQRKTKKENMRANESEGERKSITALARER
jgi:hypothetical protein